MTVAETRQSPDRKTRAGWLLIGFSLGGLFDGILLHQILQWHHLLSGLDDPAGSDLRFQIMADGLFHVLMYVLAIVGAVLLVAARLSGERARTATGILRLTLIGFGTWHILDTLLSHWILGLHRIKMDSETPLVWDVVWLVVFGILPLVLGTVLPNRGGPSRGAAAVLTTVTLAAGLAAGFGPRASGADTLVVFRPGMSPAAMMQALSAADARLKWTDASETIWAVDEVTWAGLATLHAHGAILVSSTPVLAGCLAWTRQGDATAERRADPSPA